MAKIHPTAVVDARAELADSVEVGPLCVIGPDVRIDADTRLISHVAVDGFTQIGSGCTLYPFSAVGMRTQDLKYKGGRPGLIIGNRTTIRESATVHTATADGHFTRVGDDCLLMAYSHVAHDCQVGNRVIMANSATLAGEIKVEDEVVLGGLAAVHQFCRIGRMAFIGGMTRIVQDVPPFVMMEGNPSAPRNLNLVGMERRKISAEVQTLIKRCYKLIYRENLTVKEALARIEAEVTPAPEVVEFVNFIKASERGIAR